MKKTLCLILSIIMALTALAPYQSVIAAEINKNSVGYFSDSVNEMIDTYDEDEEYTSDSESDQNLIKDRLIVPSSKVTNEYDAIESTYGMGYAVLQYETAENAETALEKYENAGYTVEYDAVFEMNSVISTPNESITWANERVESAQTIEKIVSYSSSLSEISVGVIDSGVDYTHELFTDRITDTTLNFSSSGNENDCMDDNFHGTLVAGIIAQNTSDNVKIKPYKLLNSSGNCTTSQLLAVLTYISQENDAPNILNISLGSKFKSTAITNIIQKLYDNGTVIVVGAGNDSGDAINQFPACIEDVITVSASDINNQRSSYSNFGSIVDIAAPGDAIYSAKLGGGYRNDRNGTSFACPFVAAAAATVLMQNNTLTPKDVEKTIKDAAIPVSDAYYDEEWCGSGILNYTALHDGNIIDSPSFSHTTNRYNNEFELTITAPENSTVKYTTDGSIPNEENGEVYNTPIPITEYTHIIACAIEENKRSRYIDATYDLIYLADESDFTITSSGNITKYTGSETSIIVPKTINGIIPVSLGASLFKGSDVKYVELPDTVTKINSSAFQDCKSLSKIKALGVEDIELYAFQGCSNLTEVNMPNVTFVSKNGFANCTRLQSVDFNENLEIVYEGAFSYTNFQHAYFPKLEWVTSAFNYSNLKTADFPNVEEFERTFFRCTHLYEVNSPKLTLISDNAFYMCSSLLDFDFSTIIEVGQAGFSGTFFEEIKLPNCEILGSSAFSMCQYTKYIDLPKVTEIPSNCFYICNSLENVSLPNVETFRDLDGRLTTVFSNCYNLEGLYLPKAIEFPRINWDDKGDERYQQGYIPAFKYLYAPNVETVSGNSFDPTFKYCDNIEWLFMPKLTDIKVLPNAQNATFYFSDAMASLPTNTNNMNYTIIAPSDSYAQQWSEKYGHTFIPSDSRDESIDNPTNVTDLGRSICCSAAGVRFGFTWDNIDEIESLASDVEYGFIYSQKGAENLSIDTVDDKNIKKTTANNRVDHGDTTSFNLVIANIPKDYYDREITARAYVCIDGMYFYSNTLKGSFGEVANLVLADDEIDTNSKNAVKNLLEV